jgi:DNA ligase (NAD+)
MNEGYIREFSDLYHLSEHFDAIGQMEGFGEKSLQNISAAIEKSRHVHPVNLIFALCIPMIGVDAAKKIVKSIGFDTFLERMELGIDFSDIDGIGAEKSASIFQWYNHGKNREQLQHLLDEIQVERVEKEDTSKGRCAGVTFVITGDVHVFKNRDEFKAYVESQGGKVTGSVSKKTAYLVNNDAESASSKNRKAKELGVSIITEAQFIELFGPELAQTNNP